jgi:fatty acid desaturase
MAGAFWFAAIITIGCMAWSALWSWILAWLLLFIFLFVVFYGATHQEDDNEKKSS